MSAALESHAPSKPAIRSKTGDFRRHVRAIDAAISRRESSLFNPFWRLIRRNCGFRSPSLPRTLGVRLRHARIRHPGVLGGVYGTYIEHVVAFGKKKVVRTAPARQLGASGLHLQRLRAWALGIASTLAIVAVQNLLPPKHGIEGRQALLAIDNQPVRMFVGLIALADLSRARNLGVLPEQRVADGKPFISLALAERGTMRRILEGASTQLQRP